MKSRGKKPKQDGGMLTNKYHEMFDEINKSFVENIQHDNI
jgi:hypothetical protein